MSKLPLYVLLLVSFNLVLVASQACTESKRCEEDGSCCRNGFCTTECDDFCYENSECDSGCCKDNKCEDTYETCSQTEDYSTTAPDLLNSCHYDCGDYGECCITGECRSCYHTTTSSSRGYPLDNVNYDEYNGGTREDSSVSGLTVFLIVGGIIISMCKCALCIYCCGSRTGRGDHVRRRTRYTRVLTHDEPRRGHERVSTSRPLQNDPGNPAVQPPSAYTPKFKINPKQTINPGNHNTNNVNDTQQDHRVIPPPDVPLLDLARESQGSNSSQTYPAQGVTGGVEQRNDVPQGSLPVPPTTNPVSPLANTSENSTEQNPQGYTMGPSLI
mgnify:CR=1 FL=1